MARKQFRQALFLVSIKSAMRIGNTFILSTRDNKLLNHQSVFLFILFSKMSWSLRINFHLETILSDGKKHRGIFERGGQMCCYIWSILCNNLFLFHFFFFFYSAFSSFLCLCFVHRSIYFHSLPFIVSFIHSFVFHSPWMLNIRMHFLSASPHLTITKKKP